MLPAGENTADHERHQQLEAKVIEQDKGRGPFGGRFQHIVPERMPVIRDEEDGVERCPHCTWELEDGVCGSCGFGMSDEDASSFWDDEPLAEGVMGEDMGFYGMHDGLDDEDISLHNATDVDRERARLHPYEAYHEYPYEARVHGLVQRAMGRAEGRRTEREGGRGPRRWPGSPPSPSLGDGNDDPEEGELDTDSYDSEDDDAGSLDDFIEYDEYGRPVSPAVSLSSRYATDNETATALGYNTDSSNEGFSPLHGHDGVRPGGFLGNPEDGSEDDGEALIHRPRQRQRHVRVISDDDDDDDDDDENGSADSNTVVTHDNHRSARNDARTRPRNEVDLPSQLGSQGRDSDQAPIEIDSDSEPVRMSRTPRRRAAVDRNNSDDATAVRTHYGRNSTAVRQRPLVTGQGTSPTSRPNPRGISPSFPIALDSSPVRTAPAQDRINSNSIRSSFSTSGSRHRYADGRNHRLVRDSSDSGTLPSEPETERRLANLRTRSRASPSYRHIALSSSRSRLPADAPSPANRVRHQTSPNQRASSKAQRRLAKQERRRRLREQANNITQDFEQTAF